MNWLMTIEKYNCLYFQLSENSIRVECTIACTFRRNPRQCPRLSKVVWSWDHLL